MTFEEALARLNEISAEMEKPDISLQLAVELYAEADRLIKICGENISEARITLEKVGNDAF